MVHSRKVRLEFTFEIQWPFDLLPVVVELTCSSNSAPKFLSSGLVFSIELASELGSDMVYWWRQMFLPKWRTLHFNMLNPSNQVHMFESANTAWSHQHRIVMSFSVSFTISLMCTWNRARPKTVLWVIPLATSHGLEKNLLQLAVKSRTSQRIHDRFDHVRMDIYLRKFESDTALWHFKSLQQKDLGSASFFCCKSRNPAASLVLYWKLYVLNSLEK